MRNLPQTAPRVTSISRRKLYLAMLTATQFIAAGQVWAGPEGGQVVGGAGSIKQSGTETVINQQTDRMAIDWQSFDVKVNERVQFVQPNSSSVALNRVLSNKGSEILGRVDANGHVFLVNPNGVVFGKDSHINVGGILASGMSIDPTEFMNGNFTLNSLEGTEGKVINSGIINAATGGSVTLLGKEVKNEGLIVANLGAVNLAAGKEAVVTFDSSGLVGVKITKAILQNELGVDAAVLNTGEINAQGGRILLTASTSQDIFSQAVNHGELSTATSAVVNADGSFTLGGGADVVNTGSLNASSTNGDAGQIVAVGNNVTNSGNISANTQNGKAGHIELNSTDTTQLTQNSTVTAQATASGAGGDIKILGNKVGAFDSASINASGVNGGGQILFGGDQTGKNKLVNNANFIYLGENTNAKTDALLNGNGGKLITFAQDTARIYGNLSARGGSENGNGGFIETSGLKGFEILKTPDITAKNGLGGHWLIDPYNLTIGSAGTITGAPFDATPSSSTLKVGTLLAALTDGSVVTVSTGTGGTTGQGDITLDDNLVYNDVKSSGSSYNHTSAKSTLIFNAANDIKINGNISQTNNATGNLSLQLNANNGSEKSGTGSVIVASGQTIETAGGSFTATGVDFKTTSNTTTLISTANNTNSITGGFVLLDMTGAVNISAPIITGGGSFTVGTFDTNGPLNKAGSFTNNNANGLIDTSNDFGGGDINIAATGNIDLGRIKFSYLHTNSHTNTGSSDPDPTKNVLKRIGSIDLVSDGDVSVNYEIDFNNTGRRTNAGADGYGANILDGQETELNIKAGGKISLEALISDAGWGDGRDALNINLDAVGIIDIKNDIYTAGGNFSAFGTSFNSYNHLINTDRANSLATAPAFDGKNGDARYSNGGDVTIKVSSTANLGTIVTDGDCSYQTSTACTGDLNIIKRNATDKVAVTQTAGQTLTVAGNTVFDLNTDLTNSAVTLANTGNIFTGNILFTSAGNVTLVSDAATTLGESAISGKFDLTSGGVITQSNSPDKLVVGGVTTLSATNKDITLNNLGNDFGVVNFIGNIGALDLNDTNSLSLGGVATVTNGKGIKVHTDLDLTTQAIATSGGLIELIAGNDTVNGGSLSANGALVTTGGSNTAAGSITLTAKEGSTVTTSGTLSATTLTANGGTATASNAGTAGGAITITADNDITNLGIISAIGTNANTSGIGGAGGTVNITSNVGSITAGTFTTSGGNAAGTNKAGGNAGAISLAANTNGETISFSNLTAKGGTKTGSGINGLGKDITLTGDAVIASNSITIDASGSTSGNISFTKKLDSKTAQINSLTLTGNNISFSGDVGATDRLGTLTINANGDVNSSGTTTDFTLAALNVASANNFYSNSITTADTANDKDGGSVSITGTNTVSTGDITANASTTTAGNDGKNGGAVTIIGNAISVGVLNSSGAAADVSHIGGNGGNISITAKAIANNGTESIIVKDVNANKGTGLTSGSDGTAILTLSENSKTGTSGTLSFINSSFISSNISVVGSSSTTDTLNGIAVDSTWTINGSNTIAATANPSGAKINFSSFENLVGGSEIDIFNITAAFAGNIKGGNGNNIFNIGANATKVEGGTGNDTFNITTTGALTTVLDGGTGTDTLVGSNRTNDWKLGTTESLNATLTFSNIENITGNADVDTFTFSGARNPSGNIDAKGSVDIINVATDATIDYTGTFSLFGVTNAEVVNSIAGGILTATSNSNQNIAWTIANAGNKVTDGTNEVQFTNFTTLTGGNGVDTFDITKAFSGNIKGGNGNNIFNIGANATKAEGGTGNDTFNITTTGALTTVLDGGTGTDTLVGSNRTNDWKLGTAESLNTTLTFTNIENITGNADVDTFTFSGVRNSSGAIDAKGGIDIINVATDATIDYTSTFSLFGVTNAEVVHSVAGGILTATSNSNQNITWTIANAGNKVTDGTNEVQFTNFATLIGGSGNDTFNVTDTAKVSGLIDGKAGTNILDFNSATGAYKVEVAGVVGVADLTVNNMSTIIGNDNASSALIKNSGNNTWKIFDFDGASNVVDGVNDGTLGTINFINFKNLIAGIGNDTFDFSDVASGSITGKIDGGTGTNSIKARGTGANTWSMTGNNSGSLAVTINLPTTYINEFTNIQTFSGSGSDTMSFAAITTDDVKVELGNSSSGASGITNFIGNNKDHSEIVGANTTNTWTIKSTGVNDVGGISFSNFKLLTGNTAIDNFIIESGAAFNGTINGGSGTAKNSLASQDAGGEWILDSAAARKGTLNTKSFLNIDEIKGSGTDTLTGRDQNNDWAIAGANSGDVHLAGAANIADKIIFSGIANFKGLTGIDTFTLEAAGSLSGFIDGGSPSANNILINKHSNAVWILDTAIALKGTLDGKTFQNINEIQGSGSDKLTGRNQANDWTITAANEGNVHLAGAANTADKITFKGITDLTGGTGKDTFSLEATGSLSGIIDGGDAGSNILINKHANATWILDTSTAFKGTLNAKIFQNINEIQGSGSDSLTARNQDNDWSISGANEGNVHLAGVTNTADKIIFKGMSDLSGLAGTDTFTLESAGSLSGVIDGGDAGDNILVNKHSGATWLLDSVTAHKGTLDAKTFLNINEIQGSGTDSITGRNQANDWIITGLNSGNVHLAGDTNTADQMTFNGVNNLIGNIEVDKFTFNANFIGDVKGGGKNDEFYINAKVTNVSGEAGDDKFIFSSTGNLTLIDGGAGTANTIISPTDLESSWVLTAANAGTLKSITNVSYANFQSIQVLQGSQLDSLTGRAQANKWTITGVNSGTLKEDTATPSDTIKFTGMKNLIGSTGADYFDFSTSATSEVKGKVDGGDTNNNTIKARTTANTWIMTDNTTGQVKVTNGAVYIPSFLNIQTRIGSGADTIVSDFWDLRNNSQGVTSIQGSNSLTSILIGFDAVNNWEITALNTGSITDTGTQKVVSFEGFNNLAGGNKSDTFNFIVGGSIGGVVKGAADGVTEQAGIVNSIKGINAVNTWQMTGTNSGTVTSSTDTKPYAIFSNIQKLFGGSKADLLNGSTDISNTVQTWTLGSENSLILNQNSNAIKFSDIEEIRGGTGVNTVINELADMNWLLTGANRGSINSIAFSNVGVIQGSGTDSLTGRDQDNSWRIKSVDGGEVSQSDSTDDNIKFSKMKNLIGGIGKDTFTLVTESGSTGSISGSINGGVTAEDTLNTLISQANSNTWSLDGKNTSVNGVKFVNISNVIGSAGVDIFNITSLDTLKLLMDGAGGVNDKVDLTALGAGKNVSIGVGASVATDLRITNVEIVNANNNNKNTLVADNTITGNEWSIAGLNTGTLNKNTLNNGVTFNGFANLLGGNTADNFVFTKDGMISGLIDGNSSADMNSVLDTLDLTKFETPISVAIGGTDPGIIHVSNIENIKANASVSNKLIGGNNLSYTWSLTDTNSGTVAPTTVAPALPLKETITAFSGFAQLQGGNNVDYFQISDAWTGAVDGGDGKDFVDYSSRKSAFTTVVGGTGNNSVTNVEGFVGNGTNSTIAVADGINTWTLGKVGIDADARDDGINDGQIFIGNSSQTVYFINFNNITGGTGDDTFNINSGELTGSIFGGKGNDTFKQTAGVVRGIIYGGEGDDTLFVTLGDTPADKTTFNDNEGTNTINVRGGNANYVAKHALATSAGGSLSYEANNKTQAIDYLGTFSINDDVIADRLELSGTANVTDIFSLTTNSYSLNKLTTINYKNKDNLKITGETGDRVEINGVVNIPKVLTIQNASVIEGENGVINAEGLRLDGTAAVGSLDKRVKTNIANLYLSSTLGETYLQEENSLNLTSFNTDSLFDLTLAGNLTRGAAIASTGVFNINSGTGDIKLDKADGFDANRLTGGLSLNSSGNIALSNSGTTTLNSVRAQNFNITSTDAINANGDINVIGLATFDTTGNLTATSPTNNFNSLLILNATNVDLINKGKLSVQGINASGNIATQSQGISVTGKIAGANLNFNAGSEKAILGGDIQVNNLSVTASSIDVNAALTAAAIDLNGQDGLVKLDGTLNTSGKQTVNVSAGQIIQTAKITSGGTTTLTASGDLNQKADIESGADIVVTAGGNFNLDAGKTSKGNKIEYLVQGVANFLGNITANTGIHIGGKKEVTQSALLSSADGDIKIDADKLTMSNDAITTATTGSVAVNTLGDISASALNAENGGVTFATTAGKVIDVNGDKINIVAKKLQVDSELGIGNLTDALETTVSELSLNNNGVNGGIINVQNNAAVTINRLRSNGDIIFTNLTGDVVLDNSQLAAYDKAATDARLVGGPMNSNYNIGLLTVNIANGDLLATGVPSLERPDITARAMVINAPLSSIGSKARPLVIYVNKKLEINALKLYQPYWGFNDKPDVVTGAKPISTSLSTDAGQLVQVETIDEVNPAIFTGVRNYVYDDIAILLPLDQRYGDKDTEE